MMPTFNATANKFDFALYCEEKRILIEHQLEQYLPVRSPEKLWESMRYSVLAGGKRLRAILCLASAETIGGKDTLEACLPCSCALEMIHAMSLIHDDLPALDNDDFRRGRPTNHKVYGEALALLAGDALLMLAIEILVKHTPLHIDRSLLLQIVADLCHATGASGMVGGQVLDLAFTGNQPNLSDTTKTLEDIHNGKTGALIKSAVRCGALLANATESQLGYLDQFAEKLGLAFQIADDLLDLTGNLETIGKTPGKDQAANKVTWVTVFGEQKAREKLKTLEQEGLSILDNATVNSQRKDILKELLKFAIYRNK